MKIKSHVLKLMEQKKKNDFIKYIFYDCGLPMFSN
jgi:hypothetical protein